MLPVLSRLLWLVIQPVSLAMILLLIGWLLSFRARRFWSRTFLALGVLILLVGGFTTFGYAVIAPLEGRFERPAEPARIDGIVVLGGGTDTEINRVRGGTELNRSGDRLVEAVRLALRHPEAKIVVAAGSGALGEEEEVEAVAARRLFDDFGVPAGQVILDEKSRNTQENAAFARELAGAAPGQIWLVVTSAYHMPRTMALFRKENFAVLAWPVDYQSNGTEGLRFRLDRAPENLNVTTAALREWAALFGYWVTGRIPELLPSP
ncbi:MAG: YdcF family protein [Hyphomicrobiales bacterium]|nr:MAG: YdcF family protein [Hyphomicrobiales bacterium]